MVAEITPAATAATATLANSEGRALKAGPQNVAAQASKETLNLTELASQLSELTQSVAEQPVVDSQLVATFQTAVNDGSYRVDPPAVAEKLAGFEALLTHGPRSA
ncbi:MAG: flagellar biosynthesis anti-sigma factor FlgM [Gammaproteobacteria bacterium]|nr:flagellar biosynthesis anti-sigma factor FlgM [Gammaproteobacteria bacterium]